MLDRNATLCTGSLNLVTNEKHTLEDRMAHIMVCTPMYGGMATGHYVQSLLALTGQFASVGHKVSCAFMFNESLIQRARNNMAHQFLKSDAEYLFWIDADIKFRSEDALRMLNADKDVIGGIYPKKEINWAMVREAAKRGKGESAKLHGFVCGQPDRCP